MQPPPRHRFAVALLLAILVLVGCRKSPEDNQATPTDRQTGRPKEAATATEAVFADVTRPAGLDFVHQLRSGTAGGKIANILDSDGAGGVILDYDGDGWMDVYLVNSGASDASLAGKRATNRLFRNRGDGTFEDVTEKAGVAGHGFGVTAAAADYDNDGHADLLVVNFGGCILYHNQGDGTFRDVTLQAGIRTTQDGISATFLDVDGDGYLDLFIANYLVFDPAIKVPPGSSAPYPGPLAYPPEFNILYRNRGDGTFEDISEQAGIRIAGHRAMSVTSLDFDLDGDPDIYVSNDGTPNLLLVNDGHGHFREEGVIKGVAFNQFGAAEGSMAACVGDCSGDGLPDLFVTRFGLPSLYLNSAGGLFEDRSTPAGIAELTSKLTSWGGNFLDFDNDGNLDLFIANGDPHFVKGMPALLLQNVGNGLFKNVSAKAGPFFAQAVNARGSGAVDFDNDGRLDLVICALGGGAILVQNRHVPTNHWLKLQLEGARGNRDGFGALVRVTVDSRCLYAECRCPTSYVFQQDPRLHFGLGGHAQAERVEIRWPGGQTQTLTNVTSDQILKIHEPGASRWPGGK
jgi:hypothetical protein